MERTLRAKRIFTLGQYQNIELSDEIDGIPSELATNEDFIKQLSYLQLLNIERRINNYYLIRQKFNKPTVEEAIALIEEEISSTKQELFKIINKE